MATPVSPQARRAAVVDAPTAALCALATAGIIFQQELRAPLHLPGHRGLVWLSLLVAVRLVTKRPGPTAAVGGASAALAAGLGLAPDGPLSALTYLGAAVALDAVALLPGVRGHAWALAAAAAPVHLVALATPIARSLGVGVDASALAQGLGYVVLMHLVFGAGAGLFGWGLAAIWTRGPGASPGTHRVES
jgi:hypothetical protein